eukprot:gnl/MRDRNA2_/MRDRNA2_107620_c0_seq1.p1 gnl/MRDRNA2_/MRDRNA2_107620_c0~~gnl/MRDRNA2_/MRDRNA2_107620_c0_seq1.p1  ORF type:complete len:440 (-),score=71.97 gnl/MRDRNA2_/MRDRNA2_107620_c0_seq1:13-1332(-)
METVLISDPDSLCIAARIRAFAAVLLLLKGCSLIRYAFFPQRAEKPREEFGEEPREKCLTNVSAATEEQSAPGDINESEDTVERSQLTLEGRTAETRGNLVFRCGLDSDLASLEGQDVFGGVNVMRESLQGEDASRRVVHLGSEEDKENILPWPNSPELKSCRRTQDNKGNSQCQRTQDDKENIQSWPGSPSESNNMKGCIQLSQKTHEFPAWTEQEISKKRIEEGLALQDFNVPSGLADHVTTSLMRAEARRKFANDRSREVQSAATGLRSYRCLTRTHLVWICCATISAMLPYKLPPLLSQDDQASGEAMEDSFSQMHSLASDEANHDTVALMQIENHHRMVNAVIDWGAIANAQWQPNESQKDLQACLRAAETSLSAAVSHLNDTVIGGFLKIVRLKNELRIQRQDVIRNWVGTEIPAMQVETTSSMNSDARSSSN